MDVIALVFGKYLYLALTCVAHIELSFSNFSDLSQIDSCGQSLVFLIIFKLHTV